MNMRKIYLVILICVCCACLVGCSCGMKRKMASFTSPYSSAEDLAKDYLKAIETTDADLLKKVLIQPDDILRTDNPPPQMQKMQLHTQTLFAEKNKPWMGKKLQFVGFTLGQPAGKPRGGFQIYRASKLQFQTEDGQQHETEINWIAESNGTFKIAGLQYMNELKGKQAQRPRDILEGEGKFPKNVDQENQVNITVKPVPKDKQEPTPTPEPEKTE